MMVSGKEEPKVVSSEEFADELFEIFEEKLASLPVDEQDARIGAFAEKAANLYRESSTAC